MLVEERGLSSRLALKVAKHQEIGATLGNSVKVRELRKAPHAEAKEEPDCDPESE